MPHGSRSSEIQSSFLWEFTHWLWLQYCFWTISIQFVGILVHPSSTLAFCSSLMLLSLQAIQLMPDLWFFHLLTWPKPKYSKAKGWAPVSWFVCWLVYHPSDANGSHYILLLPSCHNLCRIHHKYSPTMQKYKFISCNFILNLAPSPAHNVFIYKPCIWNNFR